jgi:hypothetical protein
LVVDDGHFFIEHDTTFAAASFFCVVPACVVHEDVAHGSGRDAEKVGSVLPTHAVFVNQSNEGLIDQGGGLERVTGSLTPKVVAGQSPELRIDERNQLVQGFVVSVAPGPE